MAKWIKVLAVISSALLAARVEGGEHKTNNTSLAIDEETEDCLGPSVDDFPNIPLPDGVLSVVVPLLTVGYLFVFLIEVCDRHFVNCIKTIGKTAKLSSDVAGATLMAAAVSCPDLFINLIGTFVTEGDIGIGTIVGCGIFNTLAVPALCVLIAPSKSIRLKGYALSRDCIFYCAALLTLSLSLIDNKIEWYEAVTLIAIYVIYIAVLCVNGWLQTHAETALKFCIPLEGKYERTPLLKSYSILSYGADQEDHERVEATTFLGRLWFFLTTPIDWVVRLTIPPSTSKAFGFNLYPLTFVICLFWIAVVSYVIAWLITITGFQLGIPDSLVGLTFVAIGMSVPQAASSMIIARQGDGAMALSNAIGSNVFDNLLCLGLPWLLRCTILDESVVIGSKSISYSFVILITSLIFLYSAAAFNNFRLTRTVGLTLLGLYLVFAVLSALLELNIFFVANLPFCT